MALSRTYVKYISTFLRKEKVIHRWEIRPDGGRSRQSAGGLSCRKVPEAWGRNPTYDEPPLFKNNVLNVLICSTFHVKCIFLQYSGLTVS